MTKSRSILLGVLAAILLAVAALFCIGGTTSASASSMSNVLYKYKLNISSTAVASAYLYSNTSATDSTEISDGDILGFSPTYLDITIKGGGSTRYYVRYGFYSVTLSGGASFYEENEFENGTSATTLTFALPTMSTGSYTLTIEAFKQNHLSGNRTRVDETITFSFYVDRTAPTITGASSSSTGKYTNEAFTVSVSDSLSGVTTLYMCEPNSSAYNSVGGTSKTVQLGSANGLYKFQATDNAGNSSGIYYVYFDDTAPVGTAVTSNGKEIQSGGTVSESFSFSATDNSSGIVSMKYKTPDSSDWLDYTAGTTITVNDGYGVYTFQVTDKCGNVLEYTVELEDACAGGHQYNLTYSVAPTCTSGGYTLYTCSFCEQTVTGSIISALGHSYTFSFTSSTCTVGGTIIYSCTRCSDSYSYQTSDAAGHSYISTITESTCEESGYTVYTCTKCGDSYSGNTTQPLGHLYVSSTVAATCTEGGYTIYTCSRCGNSYTDSVTQPLGHSYVTTTKAATCTEYGKTVNTCQTCGYEVSGDNGVYPTGHSYTVTLLSAATCAGTGERKYVCDSCGYEYTQTISATGHNYAITSTSSKSGVTSRVYTCTLCGDSYTRELGDQHEEVASFVEDLFEQYRPYMWWVLLATAGIWSIVMGVSFAIAQKNEDKEKAKKMIVNYFVGLVVIFAILVACPLLIRGIASLLA